MGFNCRHPSPRLRNPPSHFALQSRTFRISGPWRNFRNHRRADSIQYSWTRGRVQPGGSFRRIERLSYHRRTRRNCPCRFVTTINWNSTQQHRSRGGKILQSDCWAPAQPEGSLTRQVRLAKDQIAMYLMAPRNRHLACHKSEKNLVGRDHSTR